MGQYHVIVNLDKKEVVYPHALGCGLKLWEQIANHPSTGEALIILLACSNGRGGGDFADDPMIGRWAGDRIAVVGDYAEDTDLAPEHKAESIYGSKSYKDISLKVAKVIERELDGKYTGDGWRHFEYANENPPETIKPDFVIKVLL